MIKLIIALWLVLTATSVYAEGYKHHHRSHAARDHFMKRRPCPANGRTSGSCPGWVVDHIVPLKRGGPDAPNNMQWQTVQDAKAKDRWE